MSEDNQAASPFSKATKTQRPLKMALFGPSGSGKTFSALRIATSFGGTIAVIDTERSSASLYASDFEFDTAPLTTYTIDAYVALIRQASTYDTLIIDSLSHAWEGPGGILEKVESIRKQKGYRDSMRAWGDVKPIEAQLWNAILDAPCNVIATMRSKTAYEIDKDDKGKLQVAKLGLAPVQRGDKEYEFDIVGQMDMDNTFIVAKTRCNALLDAGGVFEKPGEKIATIIKAWLSDAAPAPADAPLPDGQPDDRAAADVDPWAGKPEGLHEVSDKIAGCMTRLGWGKAEMREFVSGKSVLNMDVDEATEWLVKMQEMVEDKERGG